MNVYTRLSGMILPHIHPHLQDLHMCIFISLGNSHWQFRLSEIIGILLVSQFFLGISDKIVFLLIKLVFEGPGKLVRLEEIDKIHLTTNWCLVTCMKLDFVGFGRSFLQILKSWWIQKPVIFISVFYVITFTDWTTFFLLNLDSLKNCFCGITVHMIQHSTSGQSWEFSDPLLFLM